MTPAKRSLDGTTRPRAAPPLHSSRTGWPYMVFFAVCRGYVITSAVAPVAAIPCHGNHIMMVGPNCPLCVPDDSAISHQKPIRWFIYTPTHRPAATARALPRPEHWQSSVPVHPVESHPPLSIPTTQSPPRPAVAPPCASRHGYLRRCEDSSLSCCRDTSISICPLLVRLARHEGIHRLCDLPQGSGVHGG